MTSNTTSAEDALPPLYRAFVTEFMVDKNGTKAAIRAGYSPSGAAAQASILLRIPKVAAEIERLMGQVLAEVHERVGISLERTLREVARGAHFDVRKLFNADGSPKAIDELDDETASCIEGLEILEKYEGSGKDRVFVGNVVKYKLVKRLGYVESLMKHLGAYEKDNSQAGAAAGNAVAALLTQLKPSTIGVVAQPPADEPA